MVPESIPAPVDFNKWPLPNKSFHAKWKEHPMTRFDGNDRSMTMAEQQIFGGSPPKSRKNLPFLLKIQPNDPHFFFLLWH